jgi:hypothetical protein
MPSDNNTMKLAEKQILSIHWRTNVFETSAYVDDYMNQILVNWCKCNGQTRDEHRK